MAALMGTAIERNTAISSRNDSSTTTAMTSGSRDRQGVGRIDPGGGDPTDQGRDPGAIGGRRDDVVSQVVDQRRGGLALGRGLRDDDDHRRLVRTRWAGPGPRRPRPAPP